MAWARPPATGNWARPADPSGGASSTNYATWIELTPTTAIASQDPNSILSATSYDATGWSFTISGTSGSYYMPSSGASMVFAPKDPDGTTVSMAGAFRVCFRIDYVTQPSAGSDIGLAAGLVDGTTFGASNRWIALGSRWDASGSGPDQTFSYYNSFLSGGAGAVDSAGSTYLDFQPILYEDSSNRWEPTGGYAAWMLRSSSPTEADQLKYPTLLNFDMGTAPNLFLTIAEGVSEETIKVKVYYRLTPAYDEVVP